MANETPKEVKIDENQMFEDMFKGMPLQQVKDLIIEQVQNAQNWDKLSKAVFAGMKICSLNK